MPTYDYKCNSCSGQVESFHGVDEYGPSCCGSPMQKIFSAVAVVFKGKDWACKS